MNSPKKNRSYNRNRPYYVSLFQPETQEEQVVHEIGKAIGEQDMRFLISILHRYGLEVIMDAWNEMKQKHRSRQPIRSKKRFLNYLIQQRIRNQQSPSSAHLSRGRQFRYN